MFPPYPPRPSPPPVAPQPLIVLPLPKMAAWTSVSVTSTPLSILVSIRGVYSSSGSEIRDPDLDLFIDAQEIFGGDPDDNIFEGAHIELTLYGEWLDKTFRASTGVTIPSIEVSVRGTWTKSFTVVASPLVIEVEFAPSWLGQWTSTGSTTSKLNWVRWSKIGQLDFTIDHSNVAGERPLDWKGTVQVLLWHGDKIIAYGSNGVSVLTPSGTNYGLQTISTRGIRGKQAVADCDGVHYFVDRDAQLWKFGQGLEILDYSEYLGELGTSVVLSYDKLDQLLYICDGTKGFVFNPEAQSLGRGPANITGIVIQDGVRSITASAAITMPTFEITLDTYDLGSRKGKTVRSIEAGYDTSLVLEGSLNYRLENTGSLTSLGWYTFDKRGHCYLNSYGYEFQFSVRAPSAGWFRLDYLMVHGHVHNY